MSGDQYGRNDQNNPYQQYGQYGQGSAVPPMPSAPPPAPADGVRAVAVAVLNLSGLGLGYALVRRRLLMVLCLAATAALLLVALPADPDGVPGFVLFLYVVFLVAVAAHGAVVGLRTRLLWPAPAPLALVMAFVVLVLPAGGVVLYDNARDEATQEMLLDRLDKADQLVDGASDQSFNTAESDYRDALETYESLSADHPDSRAAAKVPDRMRTYYRTVAAPYDQKDYCTAVAPLKFLRTVPDKMPKTDLGSLAKWADGPLATSLYECAADAMSSGESTWAAQFSELLTTFPDSDQAKKVQPAVSSTVSATVKQLSGSDPCTAVDRLESLGTTIDGIQADEASVSDALAKEADRATANASTGTYNCGVDQYKDGDFEAAQKTMQSYVSDHKNAKNAALAGKIAIAAEVAQTVPAAGKKLPTTRSGGSIPVVVKNDSPDDITVMYTGPVTGSFSLPACGSCSNYSYSTTLLSGFKPCSSGKNYPQKTINLPVGTTYFVHKSKGDSSTTPASDTAKLEYGYIYTECAYSTNSLS